MEHEGLVRAVEVISNAGLDIEQIITDRHKQNAAWIRRNLPDTDHHFDIWHVSKGKLTATSLNAYDALTLCRNTLIYQLQTISVLIWSKTMTWSTYPVADHYHDVNTFPFQRIATVIKCCKHFTGLSKKIDKLAKRKDCEDVGQWRQSISNHMYWCAATTPDGNGQMMQEKWKILPLHIQNIHTNTQSQLHPQCGHGQLQGDAANRLWLQPGRSRDSRWNNTYYPEVINYS